MNFDLESLRLIWWALLGLAAIGFAISEGLTLGVTVLLPALGTTDARRRALIDSIAPTSLGSLAWLAALITILFAAWPIAYSISLASLQPLLLIVLLTWLPRPLAIFLTSCEHPYAEQYGYKMLSTSGLIITLLLGLLVGNLIKGIPFHLESDMRIVFLGDLMALFNLFALLVAGANLALLSLHGAAYIQLKAEGGLQQQAVTLLMRAGIAFLILFALAGLWITHLEGYHISSEIFPNGPSNPLAKFVKRGEGLWLDNYEHVPALSAIPALAIVCGIAAPVLAKWKRGYFAMLASSIAVAMTVATFGVSIFPFLLPSNISLNSSLTIWDSSASQITLQSALQVAMPALPLIAVYSRWLYRMFNGKIDSDIAGNGETSS